MCRPNSGIRFGTCKALRSTRKKSTRIYAHILAIKRSMGVWQYTLHSMYFQLMKNGVKNSFLAISQLIKGVFISLHHCYGDF